MSKKSSQLFDEVITNAKYFVEKQKGMWDHTRWENFLKDIQKKGINITDEKSKLLGSVLESLKKLYTRVPQFNEVISNAKDFVEKQKGMWDNTRWENFLKDIQKKGVSLSEETSGLLGAVLESLKKIYIFSPQTSEAEGDTKREQPSAPASEKAVMQKPESPVIIKPETPVVTKPETPVVKKPETPLVKKQEMPIAEKSVLTEIPGRPQREKKHIGPGRKHLHHLPGQIKRHPRLLNKKQKPVQMKKRTLN